MGGHTMAAAILVRVASTGRAAGPELALCPGVREKDVIGLVRSKQALQAAIRGGGRVVLVVNTRSRKGPSRPVAATGAWSGRHCSHIRRSTGTFDVPEFNLAVRACSLVVFLALLASAS